jgi:hypothetical protein
MDGDHSPLMLLPALSLGARADATLHFLIGLMLNATIVACGW